MLATSNAVLIERRTRSKVQLENDSLPARDGKSQSAQRLIGKKIHPKNAPNDEKVKNHIIVAAAAERLILYGRFIYALVFIF